MEVVDSETAKRKKWSALPSRLQELVLKGLESGSPIDDVAEALYVLVEDARGPVKEDAPEKAASARGEHFLDIWAKGTLLALVEQARRDEQPLLSWQDGKIQRFVEVVTALSFQPGAEPRIVPSVMLAMLEDLLDMATLEECQQVFPYLESIREHLLKAPSYLGLLRTFNKLLKRLSKTRDNVFSGRILMFMATIWQLSERSAVNTPGAFNTSVEVAYAQEADNSVDDPQVDPVFYRTFWSLQDHFRHPAPLATAATLTKFLDTLQVVLTYFAENAAGFRTAGQAEEEYNTSYLTSPKLFSLQLRDPNFRRHLLLQTLFVLQWLRADRHANKLSKPPPDMVAEVGGERLADLEAQGKRLLSSLSPHGVQFAALVEHVLEREKNWLRWKFTPVPKAGGPASGVHLCPPIPKPALQGPAALQPPGKRKAVRRVALGNEVLGRVWHSTRGDPMAALRGKGRNYVPPYLDYMQRLADELDPESGIEEQYKVAKSQVFEWRGLRLTARHNVAAFGEIARHGGDLVALLPRAMRPAQEAGAEGAEDGDNDNDVPQDDEDPGDGGAEESTPMARAESGEIDEARRKTEEATPMEVDKKEAEGPEESGRRDEEVKPSEGAAGKEEVRETCRLETTEIHSEKVANTGTAVSVKKQDEGKDGGGAAGSVSKEEASKDGAERGAASAEKGGEAAASVEQAKEKVGKPDEGASRDSRATVEAESRKGEAANDKGAAEAVLTAPDTIREGRREEKDPAGNGREKRTVEKGPEGEKVKLEASGTLTPVNRSGAAGEPQDSGKSEETGAKRQPTERIEPTSHVNEEGRSGPAADPAPVKQKGSEVGAREAAAPVSRSEGGANQEAKTDEAAGPFVATATAIAVGVKDDSGKVVGDAATGATAAAATTGKERSGADRKKVVPEDRSPGDIPDRAISEFADSEEGPSQSSPLAKGSPTVGKSRLVSGQSEEGKEKAVGEAAVKEAEGGGKGRGRGRGRGKRKPEETMEDLASRRVTRRRR